VVFPSQGGTFLFLLATSHTSLRIAWEEGVLSVSLDQPDEQNPALVQALVNAGAQIRSVEPISHSLEEVYLELVENERQAAAVSR